MIDNNQIFMKVPGGKLFQKHSHNTHTYSLIRVVSNPKIDNHLQNIFENLDLIVLFANFLVHRMIEFIALGCNSGANCCSSGAEAEGR